MDVLYNLISTQWHKTKTWHGLMCALKEGLWDQPAPQQGWGWAVSGCPAAEEDQGAPGAL